MGKKGFTTVELIVAIVIAVILVGVAIPSFVGTIQRSRLGGATRHLVAEIRAAQSMAVTRSGFFGLHWGADPGPPAAGRSNSEYRIEQDPGGACAWPAPTDTSGTNLNVITDWTDVSREYPGVTIQSVQDGGGNPVGGVIFNSRGLSLNTCVGVTFPVTLTIADNSGASQTIQVNRAGRVTIQ